MRRDQSPSRDSKIRVGIVCRSLVEGFGGVPHHHSSLGPGLTTTRGVRGRYGRAADATVAPRSTPVLTGFGCWEASGGGPGSASRRPLSAPVLTASGYWEVPGGGPGTASRRPVSAPVLTASGYWEVPGASRPPPPPDNAGCEMPGRSGVLACN